MKKYHHEWTQFNEINKKMKECVYDKADKGNNVVIMSAAESV